MSERAALQQRTECDSGQDSQREMNAAASRQALMDTARREQACELAKYQQSQIAAKQRARCDKSTNEVLDLEDLK